MSSNKQYCLRSREYEITNELQSTSSLIQQLYFETQSGLTRRNQGVVINELNGNLPDVMLLNLYNNIQSFSETLSKESDDYKQLLPILKEIEDSKNYFLALSLLFFETHQKKQDYWLHFISTRALESIHTMSPNESRLFPGGYTNINPYEFNATASGHVLTYEITKQLNGKFKFTILNTGEGIVYPYQLIMLNY